MSSLIRSTQNISQVLRNISTRRARAGFAQIFYTGLMRTDDRKGVVNQSLAWTGMFGLMKIGQLISQRLRYTLR
jgi:hypothetical protein